MASELFEKRNITPEKAVEILEKHGINVSIKKAEEILDLMYFLAKLIVKQNLIK